MFGVMSAGASFSSFGVGFNMQMSMGGMGSTGFMGGMGMFGGMSSMCCGMGPMVPFGGMPMMMPGMGMGMGMGTGMGMGMNSGVMGDAEFASMMTKINSYQAQQTQKMKSAMGGNFLGKLLGLAGGIGLAALVVGTGGAALPVLLAAGSIGAGVGGSLGFLMGGGGELMKPDGHKYMQFYSSSMRGY